MAFNRSNLFGMKTFKDWLASTYAAKVHTHKKADITDFTHTHTVSQITDFSSSTVETKYPLRSRKITADTAATDFKRTSKGSTTVPADWSSVPYFRSKPHNRSTLSMFLTKWTQIKDADSTARLAIFGARKWSDSDGTVHLQFYVFDRGDCAYWYSAYPFNFTLPDTKYLIDVKETQVAAGDGDSSHLQSCYTKGFSFRGYSGGVAVNFLDLTFYPIL